VLLPTADTSLFAPAPLKDCCDDDVGSTVSLLEFPTIISALGTFGLAPYFSITNLQHLNITDSCTFRARTISTRYVPPVCTRRLIAIGPYSIIIFLTIDGDNRFLVDDDCDCCACSVSSRSAFSFRDSSRLYVWIYSSFGDVGLSLTDRRRNDNEEGEVVAGLVRDRFVSRLFFNLLSAAASMQLLRLSLFVLPLL